MKTTYAASIARHAATFVGGYLAARGMASQEETEQLIASVLTIAGILWSMWQKAAAARDAAAAAQAATPPPAAPPAP